MRRAAADLSTGTTPARGVGPCRACQVGEERAAAALLQPAIGRRWLGQRGGQNRPAQNRTYGVPAGRPVRENLSRGALLSLVLFSCASPLDFCPFPLRVRTPFVPLLFPPLLSSTGAPNSSISLFCFCFIPSPLFWAARQQHDTLCLPASLFLADEGTARVRGGSRVGKGE